MPCCMLDRLYSACYVKVGPLSSAVLRLCCHLDACSFHGCKLFNLNLMDPSSATIRS